MREADELTPLHPTHDANTSTSSDATRTGCRSRVRSRSHPKPSKSAAHTSGIAPHGNPSVEIVPVVIGAVVDSVTVTGAVVPDITLTELGKLQAGAGVTVGLMLQVRFTGPLNPLAGVMAKLNVVLRPALMVWEVGDPAAVPNEKSGAIPTPDNGTICRLPRALSVIVTAPV